MNKAVTCLECLGAASRFRHVLRLHLRGVRHRRRFKEGSISSWMEQTKRGWGFVLCTPLLTRQSYIRGRRCRVPRRHNGYVV